MCGRFGKAGAKKTRNDNADTTTNAARRPQLLGSTIATMAKGANVTLQTMPKPAAAPSATMDARRGASASSTIAAASSIVAPSRSGSGFTSMPWRSASMVAKGAPWAASAGTSEPKRRHTVQPSTSIAAASSANMMSLA